VVSIRLFSHFSAIVCPESTSHLPVFASLMCLSDILMPVDVYPQQPNAHSSTFFFFVPFMAFMHLVSYMQTVQRYKAVFFPTHGGVEDTHGDM